ncbi:MAG: 30S ribosomal protein S2 [Christensenellales bacterium]
MSVISMKQLLEAGVHFGHQTRKWNPKMARYIFTSRNDIHVINLEQTAELIDSAYAYVRDAVKDGKTVLFVGTKKQAQDAVKEEAERCGMYYVNSRWLGGTLTNFKTIRSRVEKLNKLEQMEKTGEFDLLPKKEVAGLKAEKDKLEKFLGGIKDMTKLPGLIFVVDSKKEAICVKEAKLLGIPVVGLIDTNCDPDMVDVVIPGNDDAIRSVKLIASAIADAVIEAKEGEEGLAARKKAEEEANATEETSLQEEIKMEDALTVEVVEEKAEEEAPAKPKRAKKSAK